MDNMTQSGDSPVIQWAMQQQASTQSPPDQSLSTSGDSPIIQWAMQQQGSPTNTPEATDTIKSASQDLGDRNYNNLCEKFVEQNVYRKTGIYPTAIAAAQHYISQGKMQSNVQQAPSGSMIYFSADRSNGGYGHVAISDGNGNIVGATSQGVQSYNLNDWISKTGQNPIGFVTP